MAVPIEDLACATDRADAGLHKRCYGFEVTSLIALAISSLSLDSPSRKNRMPGRSKGRNPHLGIEPVPGVICDSCSHWDLQWYWSGNPRNFLVTLSQILNQWLDLPLRLSLECLHDVFLDAQCESSLVFTVFRTVVCLLKEVEALFAIEFFCFASLVTKRPSIFVCRIWSCITHRHIWLLSADSSNLRA